MMRGVAAIVFTIALLLGHLEHAVAQSPDVLRNRVNQGTVAIISGGVNGTYIRIASDLAAVLDKGDQLRILPIIGKGSVQNITDLLYLRGIDIGIVQSDVLSFIRKENLHPNIAQRIRYVTKLYNEEVHILAGKDIAQLADLAGKKRQRGCCRQRHGDDRFDVVRYARPEDRGDQLRSGARGGKSEGRRDRRHGLRRR